jgi:hypothetical protein
MSSSETAATCLGEEEVAHVCMMRRARIDRGRSHLCIVIIGAVNVCGSAAEVVTRGIAEISREKAGV